MSVLRACVVGLGQVGLRFDLEEERRRRSQDVWTHFTAYEKLRDRFKIVAAVEPNETYWAPALARAPDLKIYKSAAECLTDFPGIDVVSVCVPDRLHLETLDAFSDAAKAFFLEKPVSEAGQTAEAEKLIGRLRERRKTIYVNYVKRSEPAVLRLLSSLAERGETPRFVECRYSGPFLATGSHAVDLLNHVQEICELQGSLRHECAEGEGFSALFKSADGTAMSLSYTGPRHDLVFDLEVIAGRSRYRLSDNLCRFERSDQAPSTRYQGYREYGAAIETGEYWENPNRFVHFLELLHEDVTKDQPRYDNVDKAMRTQRLMTAVKNF